MDFRLDAQRGLPETRPRAGRPLVGPPLGYGWSKAPRLKGWLRSKESAEDAAAFSRERSRAPDACPRLVPEPVSRTVSERNLKGADSFTLVQQISNRYR